MKYLQISVFNSPIVIFFVSYLPFRAHIASQRTLFMASSPSLFHALYNSVAVKLCPVKYASVLAATAAVEHSSPDGRKCLIDAVADYNSL